MEKKQSLLQFAITYGVILGIISIIFSLIMYIAGYIPYSIKRMLLTGLISLVIIIVFVSTGMKSYRDKMLDGNISYGQAFLVGFLIVLFSSILTGIYGLIFNTIIDPDYTNRVMEATKNWTYDMMNNMGTPDANIEEAMDKIDKQQANATPVKQFFQGILMSTIFGTIISLIVAAFTKKTPNPVL